MLLSRIKAMNSRIAKTRDAIYTGFKETGEKWSQQRYNEAVKELENDPSINAQTRAYLMDLYKKRLEGKEQIPTFKDGAKKGKFLAKMGDAVRPGLVEVGKTLFWHGREGDVVSVQGDKIVLDIDGEKYTVNARECESGTTGED